MEAVAKSPALNVTGEVEGKRLRGVRVFIAEDEVLIAMEVQANLEDDGAKIVGPSHTLAQAMECAANDSICVAVLDLRLGRDSIAPVVRLLAGRKIPFLFYSGQASVDPISEEWPNTIIISKPASAFKLVGAVVSLLERSKKERRDSR